MKKLFLLTFISCLTINTFAQSASGGSNKKQPYTYAEQMPEFPGGTDSLLSYLSANIHYPEDVHPGNVQHKVIVKFVVCKDGSIQDATVIKSVNASCDAEVLRVVKAMPRWRPGMENGKAVNIYFTLPVSFDLENPEPKE